jgi:hypothetical protein
MAEAIINNAPANWQVTATTIECCAFKEYVTILVNKDWSAKCIWWAKYKKMVGEEPKYKFSREIKDKIGRCQGPNCQSVYEYRDKLIKEE